MSLWSKLLDEVDDVFQGVPVVGHIIDKVTDVIDSVSSLPSRIVTNFVVTAVDQVSRFGSWFDDVLHATGRNIAAAFENFLGFVIEALGGLVGAVVSAVSEGIGLKTIVLGGLGLLLGFKVLTSGSATTTDQPSHTRANNFSNERS